MTLRSLIPNPIVDESFDITEAKAKGEAFRVWFLAYLLTFGTLFNLFTYFKYANPDT